MNYFETIKGKHLVDLTLNELAYVHLNSSTCGFDIKEGTLESGLPYLVNEINHVKQNIHSNNLVPIISSFAILDQLGFCYQRKDMPDYSNDNASGVKTALYYFCGLPDESDDLKALYSLRNSLMHNGSLLSKGGGRNSKHFSFLYDRDLTTIVEHPQITWDGVFNNLQHPKMLTKVNPDLIISFAQDAVKKAGELLEASTLKVVIPEIEMYYTFLNCIPKTKINEHP